MTSHRIVQLGQIASISSGGTPSRTKPSYWGGKIPWVKTTQIQNCWIHEHDVDEWITEEGLRNSSAKLVPAGTILIGMIGQGKTRGQAGLLTFEATTSQNAATVTLGKQSDPFFVFQQLLFKYEDIRSLSNNSGQGSLNIELIKSIEIDLPPLPEQKAIADTLSTWDTAIEKMERLIAAKERRFLSLVDRLITRPIRARTWDEVLVGSFLEESRIQGSPGDRAKKLTVKLYGKGAVPKSEVRQGSESTQYYVRRAGQFIYSKLDFLNGAFAIIPPELDGYESTLDLPAFDVSDKVSADWLLYFVTRPEFYQSQVELARGQRIARRINPSDFLSSKIPLPSLKEQRRIVDILDQAKSEYLLTSRQLNLLRRQKRGLMQKLLTGTWRIPVPREIP